MLWRIFRWWADFQRSWWLHQGNVSAEWLRSHVLTEGHQCSDWWHDQGRYADRKG